MRDRIFINQPVAAGGHHHGIEYRLGDGIAIKTRCHGFDHAGFREHTDFHGIDAEVGKYGLHLRCDEVGFHIRNGRNTECILGRESR